MKYKKISVQQAKQAWVDGEPVEYYALSQWCRLTKHNTLETFEMFNNFRVEDNTVKFDDVTVEIPKSIVVDPVTGSVGLVYGNNKKAKQVKDMLTSLFYRKGVFE